MKTLAYAFIALVTVFFGLSGGTVQAQTAPIDQWGFYGGRIGNWHFTPGTAGNVTISGNTLVDFSAIRGGFSTITPTSTSGNALVVTGTVEFVGGGFESWSALRYGIFYSDNAGALITIPVDSTRWSGTEEHNHGYLFTPYGGEYLYSGVSWAADGYATTGAIVDARWMTTNDGASYTFGEFTQKPANAAATAGLYDFAFSVQPLTTGAQEVRFYLIKQGTPSTYYFAGTFIDSHSPVATSKFNCICFAIQNNSTSSPNPNIRAMKLTNVKAGLGNPIIVLEPPFSSQNFWRPTNVPGGPVYSLAINSNGHIFAGTDQSGVYRSTDNGVSWTQINSGLKSTFIYSLAINSSGNIFAGTSGIYVSADNGEHWAEAGLTDISVTAIAFNSSGHIFAGTAFGGTGVYRSTDNGKTWTETGSSGGYITYSAVNSIAINSSGHIFAGTEGGAVYRSTNNGYSWVDIWSGLARGNSLAINMKTGYIFAGIGDFTGSDGDLYRSTDNGNSWSRISLPGGRIYALAINSDDHIFSGTASAGVYRSTNNGAGWVQTNGGLTDMSIAAIAISPSGYIFAGTWEHGLFRSVLPTTTSVEQIAGIIPSESSLEQNYPNPFNPTTNISFSLPSKSFVSLKAFDVLGREVAVLLSEELSAGRHTRQWNASSLASGVYFYRMQAGSFIDTKKLILLR